MTPVLLNDRMAEWWSRALQVWCHECGRVHWRDEWIRGGLRCPTVYCGAHILKAGPWHPDAWPLLGQRYWPIVADDGAFYPTAGGKPRHPVGSVVAAHRRLDAPDQQLVRGTPPGR